MGAAHSIMSKSLYDSNFNNLSLLENDISLRDYVGNVISPIGNIIVNTKYLKNTCKMCIYVIKTKTALKRFKNNELFAHL